METPEPPPFVVPLAALALALASSTWAAVHDTSQTEAARERRLFRESERCAAVYEGVREFRFFDEQCQLRYKGEWRNADDIEWIERPKWTRP